MNVSLNWLGDHLDLAGHSTDALADLLTFAGIEVEGVETLGGQLENVVVAQIKSAEKHPDADRLKVCQVDDGTPELRQIVCGAQNYKVGDRVPLALPGAELPNGLKIKPGKLRGVASHGMLCSPAELGVPLEIDGLWILPEDSAAGAPISDLIGSDTIFDLEITPNRPDLLSHLGVARDLAALAKIPLKGRPGCYGTVPTAASDAVAIAAPDACPFYSARRISGVAIGPSPEWLAKKLRSIGLRPINNVVDITNYVLHEMGQPLHAFDADKLDGAILVRRATAGEKFLALDGETYPLQTDDLVIADAARPVALAGVMGGEDSGVTGSTTNLVLESAYFDPPGIRRTSRRLALGSDSSYRFERGVDPAQVLGASELATRLILEIAGGTAEPEVITAGEIPASPPPVALAIEHVQQVMGIPLAAEKADQILGALGLAKAGTTWEIPSYRLDLTRPIDLIEEIARVYGLDDIPSSTSGRAAVASEADGAYDFTFRIKRDLAAQGFFECSTIKLISDAQRADCLLLDDGYRAVPLKNPLSDDHTVMRTSVLPGLLASAERNVRMGQRSLRLFETGTVYREESGGTVESQHLGMLLAGAISPVSWTGPTPRNADVFDLSGHLAFLAGTQALTLIPENDPPMGCPLSARVAVGGQPVGRAIQLAPGRVRELGLDCPAMAVEIDLPVLRTATGAKKVVFSELPRFPAMTRDVAMELPESVPNSEIAAFFAQTGEPLLHSAVIFDLFTDPSGEKVATGRKSVAYTITYRDPRRTLTTAEVDSAHQRVLDNLKLALPATIR